jgi:hypothetical protein
MFSISRGQFCARLKLVAFRSLAASRVFLRSLATCTVCRGLVSHWRPGVGAIQVIEYIVPLINCLSLKYPTILKSSSVLGDFSLAPCNIARGQFFARLQCLAFLAGSSVLA